MSNITGMEEKQGTGKLPSQKESLQPEGKIYQDAKKYKTADDFIKSSKEIYHGTDKIFDNFDVKKSADGTIWFTDNKEKINKGEVAASGKGRIVNRFINENDLKLGGWDEQDKYSTDQLINMGYDGLKLPDKDETTYQIFNPEKLKTKEQLTDIYNKANESKPSEEKSQMPEGKELTSKENAIQKLYGNILKKITGIEYSQEDIKTISSLSGKSISREYKKPSPTMIEINNGGFEKLLNKLKYTRKQYLDYLVTNSKNEVANGEPPLIREHGGKQFTDSLGLLAYDEDGYIDWNKTFDLIDKFSPIKEKSLIEPTRAPKEGAQNRFISDESYQKAGQRIIDKFSKKIVGDNGGVNSPLDTQLIKDLATVGAYHVENGLRSFSDWGKKMVEDFGDKTKPYLLDIWRQSKKDFPDLFKEENPRMDMLKGNLPKSKQKIDVSNLNNIFFN